MILLITNSSDVTTDFLVKKLTNKNLHFYRLNTNTLFEKTNVDFNFQKGEFIIQDLTSNIEIDLSSVRSVYYRRPELPLLERYLLDRADERFIKNEFLFCLEGLYKLLENAFWVNNVYRIREAENKIYQLQLAKKMGFQIPNSIISNRYGSVSTFFYDNANECITKPIKSGLIEDNPSRVVFTSNVVPDSLEEERVKFFPNFFQRRINKVADIRVTVVRDRVFPVKIEIDSDHMTVDWRSVDPAFLKYSEFALPDAIENRCLGLTKCLGLNYSAIDLAIDGKGEIYFLEINPNGQWGWIEKRMNNGISDALVDLLENENR
jgi:glutathione synthase/RimK-type ligase-like ATP-grasp enzyme